MEKLLATFMKEFLQKTPENTKKPEDPRRTRKMKQTED
jgi:hypothetical protein